MSPTINETRLPITNPTPILLEVRFQTPRSNDDEIITFVYDVGSLAILPISA
jgi:hypothetical protein